MFNFFIILFMKNKKIYWLLAIVAVILLFAFSWKFIVFACIVLIAVWYFGGYKVRKSIMQFVQEIQYKIFLMQVKENDPNEKVAVIEKSYTRMTNTIGKYQIVVGADGYEWFLKPSESSVIPLSLSAGNKIVIRKNTVNESSQSATEYADTRFTKRKKDKSNLFNSVFGESEKTQIVAKDGIYEVVIFTKK